MEELFTEILKHRITPNQLYLLYAIRNKVSTVGINPHLELRGLVPKFVDNKELTGEAQDLLNYFDGVVGGKKAKVTKSVLGNNAAEMIQKYMELFPKKKLPSGKLARSNVKNLETNFKWFFSNFDYSWETILKATGMYVDEYEKNNFMYMQTSKYFICKTQSDKSKLSELADYCELVESGGELDTDSYFKEKVV